MKNYFRKNPRRSFILGSYLLAFIFMFVFTRLSLAGMLLVYLALTLVYIGVFFVDCAAVLGNIYFGRGNADRAAALYQFSIKRNTKSPSAHLYYAIYLLRRNGVTEAAPLLEKALLLKPKLMTEKNIQLTRASCRWVLGNVDGAIEILEKMRVTYEYVNARVIATLAYMYFIKGDMEQAEALSLAAIEDTPESYAAWDNLGQIYYRKNDLPRAKEAFQKALSFKDEMPESLYGLGLIARDENENEQAAEYFTKALSCAITPLSTVTREQITEALEGL